MNGAGGGSVLRLEPPRCSQAKGARSERRSNIRGNLARNPAYPRERLLRVSDVIDKGRHLNTRPTDVGTEIDDIRRGVGAEARGVVKGCRVVPMVWPRIVAVEYIFRSKMDGIAVERIFD